MRNAKFTAQLIEGHKGVVAVLVPFDPQEVWGLLPHRLAGRRHGWPVRGRAGKKKFVGYIGERWGNFFVTLDSKALGLEVGDSVELVLEPTSDKKILATAIEQSRVTTQPKKARAEVRGPGAE